FFFQAEDGIRDKLVTGVQTCALPIFSTVPYLPGDRLALNLAGEKEFDRVTRERFEQLAEKAALSVRETAATVARMVEAVNSAWRSEERRVGKEGRWGWGM